jgi:glycosyltransferase involved in cell wall biosynthesis
MTESRMKQPTPASSPAVDDGVSPLIVIVLTFNSAGVIERTIRAARQVTSNILAVDSNSTDDTVSILDQLGCRVVKRPFVHYADQRNWAIREFGNQHAWQLHLDADEELDAMAIDSIRGALRNPGNDHGFLLQRLTYFMGRSLPFAGENSWHMRLFRSGSGTCEDRLYDQHFLCTGAVRRLRGLLHDHNVGSLAEWVARHNRWSDLESQEIATEADRSGQLAGELSGDPRQRRRLYKGIYYRLPPGLRAVAYFIFRYVGCLGFLDGAIGFYYTALQAFWFRLLVDAKLRERR